MSGIILARGRGAEATFGAAAEAGAAFIALPGADAIFLAGAPLFASEEGGAETEYLGSAEEVSEAGVAFALPLAAAKSANALLWQPAAWTRCAPEISAPLEREIATGVAFERSLAGQAYAIRAHRARETIEATLAGLAPREADSIAEFLAGAAEAGLGFTLIELPRRATPVRLETGGYRRIARAGAREEIRMRLGVERGGGYL